MYCGIAKEKLINFAHFQIVTACTRDFPNEAIDNMATSLIVEGKLSFFGSGQMALPQNLIQ